LKSRASKYLLIMLAVIFWGYSFIAVKIALRELSPQVIVSLRLIIASVFLLVVAIILKKDFSIDLKNHGFIFILALISVFHLWIQVVGLKYTTASNSGWIVGTAPVFIAILGGIFFKEKFSKLKLLGILIAMFGLLLLVSSGNLLSISLIENKGDFLMLLSAFIWGVYSIANKKISITYSPLMTILFLFIMMSIIIVPFNLNEASINSVAHLSAEGWAAIIFLGLFCSGIAYVIWAFALSKMDSGKVGVFLYFEPFVTVLAAWSFLNEQITLLMLIAGIIITIGVVLVNKE
jgi:RarD protein